MRLFSLVLTTCLLIAGCATTLPFTANERPESLDPFRLDLPPVEAYERAMALAFDRGFNIAYSARAEGLIEMDRLDRRFLRETRVRRLDVLIQPADTLAEDQSLVRIRYQSFPPENPAHIGVQDEDREAAEAFAQALRQRVAAR